MAADITTTEFSPVSEAVSAQIDLRAITGEIVAGSIAVGHYRGSEEIWLKQEGKRVQFDASALPAVIKQLRRAAKIAQENMNG